MSIIAEGRVEVETLNPFVFVEWTDDEKRGQLTSADAHKLAWRIVSAAIEAERDAGLMKFATTDVEDGGLGLPKKEAAKMLIGMRNFRKQYDPDGPWGLWHTSEEDR